MVSHFRLLSQEEAFQILKASVHVAFFLKPAFLTLSLHHVRVIVFSGLCRVKTVMVTGI